jgi:tRNA-dihydrouridine synthase B
MMQLFFSRNLDRIRYIMQIGNLKLKNRLIMAPMAGITNKPFRVIIRGMGASLAFTEMVSAMGLTLKAEKTWQYLKSGSDDMPLAVQIFGSRPDVIASAAGMAAQTGADIIDINMGCPVKKVTKTGAGASLLKDFKRVEKIVSSARVACQVPLTVKIRAGWSPETPVACEIARVIEDCGADALTVHPRFATQGYSDKADWALIGKVKARLKIPVIGNGDILGPRDALNMIRQTGCDGVMIGRAAVRDPWIFRNIVRLEQGLPVLEPELPELRSLIIEHYNLLSVSANEYRAALCMRGHLLHYTKGLPHSSHFREKFTKIQDFKTLMEVVDRYFTVLEEKRS